MVRKSYTPEQVSNKLRETEVLLSQRATIAVITRSIGLNDHTYYRWQLNMDGMTCPHKGYHFLS